LAVDDAEAMSAGGLGEISAERLAALQSFAPTGYLAVGVN
jgi:hypothetical protein